MSSVNTPPPRRKWGAEPVQFLWTEFAFGLPTLGGFDFGDVAKSWAGLYQDREGVPDTWGDPGVGGGSFMYSLLQVSKPKGHLPVVLAGTDAVTEPELGEN